MKRTSVLVGLAALLGMMVLAVSAQNRNTPEGLGNSQDGFVPTGTRLLVRLDDTINTKEARSGSPFQVHTLEPAFAADGMTLPAGSEIRGHVDRVDQAHQTGRARLWLTFDDVHTLNGWRSLVAFVSDIPGVHSLRVVFESDDAIEMRTSRRQDEAVAAAAGALVGAAPGVATHSGKEAATGAAVGAVTAFMVSSGLGQELALEKNTKLEISLDHPLYLGRE
ncbi:MAG TPA: hypothetical protein VMH00_08830 [Candidatus Limnocylindrales bacterium]|nr:hypothetical protein [Candidatus Limnocylindrales bacterium]